MTIFNVILLHGYIRAHVKKKLLTLNILSGFQITAISDSASMDSLYNDWSALLLAIRHIPSVPPPLTARCTQFTRQGAMPSQCIQGALLLKMASRKLVLK